MKKTTRVFWVALVVSILFIIWGVVPKDVLPNGNLQHVTNVIQTSIIEKFGWFYLLSATGFLVFSLTMIFTRYGNIKLGKDKDEPEFGILTWFAMLFSAGMGIGLVFWGVAEPLSHYYDPPAGKGQTTEAAKLAVRYSFFHWGLHPWGIYAVIGLILAYFNFRRDTPGVVSQILKPIFGDRVNGPLGVLFDFIAIFATVFGVATSLGFGATQISGGVSYLFPAIHNTFTTQLIIIIIVTFFYMLSASTGLEKGIAFLSNANILLAILLMLFLLFAGPTNFIMDLFTTTLGGYLQNLVSMSFRLSPFEQNTWVQDWTIFYWAWWIAWAPFVGTFIARVSKGRTIREFIIGVLLVPTLFGALWFSVFGGSAVWLEFFKHAGINEIVNNRGQEIALFTVLSQFPLGTIMSYIAIFLIGTFFITSADSATFVLGMQSTGGSLNPPNRVKLTWGVIQSASAAVLLWAGGLEALQTASIIAAFPFTIIMILMIFSLVKSLKVEKKVFREKLIRRIKEATEE
ncbi:BCCT family transporter [Neobacillus mesonae]|uniref:glycine betaine uptake BCCT transporter n=1 Tax=Neobacillus mesonae TaxID=1193713 RepID=UPI00203F7796|nr:BCCT family transporter [Neobacillus mesonae]MCM3569460.1 BCCT family transporter [Neobacillus mesonae]